MFQLGHVFEGISVLPDVDGRTGRYAAEYEDGDYQIDETLLNNPPIKGEMTGLIPYHELSTWGRGSTRG
jgi:hypothetical protein